MDPISIAVAFLLGFVARQINLPPLVGFLLAGFVLQQFGVVAGETIETIADLGVTLLLFTIGLKLKIKSLLRPEVWAGASLHCLAVVVLFGVVFYGLSVVGFSIFAGMAIEEALLLSFALSFLQHRLCRQGLGGEGRDALAAWPHRDRRLDHAGCLRRGVLDHLHRQGALALGLCTGGVWCWCGPSSDTC